MSDKERLIFMIVGVVITLLALFTYSFIQTGTFFGAIIDKETWDMFEDLKGDNSKELLACYKGCEIGSTIDWDTRTEKQESHYQVCRSLCGDAVEKNWSWTN